MDSNEHFDVLIVGGGLSGVGAACRLQEKCPGKSYVILEGREAIGGTWDLFRYPGIRSDSDMFTLGYPFRPWKDAKSIADGSSILEYIRETAADEHVTGHIRLQHRVTAAAWSTQESRWTVEAEVGAERRPVRFTCGFLYLCSGYYSYEGGYLPEFPGAAEFGGRLIHPQKWPEGLDTAGKSIVVIGSGATAVTLVPALARTAAHVTMLQRSPSYIASLPAVDAIADTLRRRLPEKLAHSIARWKNVLIGMAFFQFARRAPEGMKKRLLGAVARALPPGIDVAKHFTPTYNPWDQRLCLVPNSDLFEAFKSGQASIETDRIERFTATGIRLASGRELQADIIVAATGLKLVAGGGVKLSVDGAPTRPGLATTYKGLMLSGIPNLALCVGYTNASWTLKADLSSLFVTRLLNHMDRHGYAKCEPVHAPAQTGETLPLLNLTSGYITRGADELPKQGTAAPWVHRQNYLQDLVAMRFGRLEDGALIFSRPVAEAAAQGASPALQAA